MKKTRRFLTVLLAVLLVLAAVGCGARSSSMDYAAAESSAAYVYDEADYETPAEEYVQTEAEETGFSTTPAVDDAEDTVADANASADAQTLAEKIIYSGSVYLETTQFDESIETLEKTVKEYGGFIQDSNISGVTRDNGDGTTSVVSRWGYYTVRIPSTRFDEFMTMTGTLGNVTSSGRSAENVTSQYTDYEARLSSLNTQEERLLAMLEKSEDVESLIELESRLSEVRYEIESIEQNLRNLDQRLSYSTVTLELQEVAVYTPTATVNRTFGEELRDALQDGWSGFADGMKNLLLTLVLLLPLLLLLAVVAVVVILLIRRHRRKKQERKAKVQSQEQTRTEEKTE